MEYSKGHIYKIICSLDSNFVYIGSTFTTLRQRWQKHKSKYINYLNGINDYIATYPYYDKYGIENFKILRTDLIQNDTHILQNKKVGLILLPKRASKSELSLNNL